MFFFPNYNAKDVLLIHRTMSFIQGVAGSDGLPGENGEPVSIFFILLCSVQTCAAVMASEIHYSVSSN